MLVINVSSGTHPLSRTWRKQQPLLHSGNGRKFQTHELMDENGELMENSESSSSKAPTGDEESGAGGSLCQENGFGAGIAYRDIICIHVKEWSGIKSFKHIYGESLHSSWHYVVRVSCRCNEHQLNCVMKREEPDKHTDQLVEHAWERCRWGWEV